MAPNEVGVGIERPILCFLLLFFSSLGSQENDIGRDQSFCTWKDSLSAPSWCQLKQSSPVPETLLFECVCRGQTPTVLSSQDLGTLLLAAMTKVGHLFSELQGGCQVHSTCCGVALTQWEYTSTGCSSQ